MTATLIRGGWVLTAATPRPAASGAGTADGAATPAVVRHGAVLIADGVVQAVGTFAELSAAHPEARVHGGPNDIVTPGFVNTHGHFSEGLITGIASQYTLWEWISALINPVSPHLDREMAYTGTLLAGMQMLQSGITTANDMFVTDPGIREPITPGVVEALDELNLRGVVSFGAGDMGSTRGIDAEFDEHEALREAAAASRLSTFRVGIGAVGGQSDAMFERSIELAVNGVGGGGHGTDAGPAGFGVHIHLQEIREEVTATMQRKGLTAIGYSEKAGLFEAPTLAAHCVWLDRADRDILARNRVGVAHNPVSNMILASGVAPVAELRQLGVDVGIGVDGPASNDSQDMMQAVKSAALLARVHHQQATAMSAEEAFELATIGGARALRMQDTIGSLEPGKAADLIVFDGDAPALANVHDPFQAIVFAAGARDIASVWVDGRPSVMAGEVVTVDARDTVERSRPLARRLVRAAGLGHLSELAR
ncbi:amidohydrolase family protein [Herbiconiux moechotypicola]|nr:amidohydrolase family protein [Herbiconiux moechotypicola]MCS5730069.1 amidohydrolase family protein [Herbiconiux moechotypicola]